MFFYFKDILQHFKFVNWRIRFLMSRTGYKTTSKIGQFLVTLDEMRQAFSAIPRIESEMEWETSPQENHLPRDPHTHTR